MRTSEWDPKLTETVARLYAGWRDMSDRGVEFEPRHRPQERRTESGIILPRGVDLEPERASAKRSPRVTPERKGEQRHLEGPRFEAQRLILARAEDERKGLAENISGANEFVGEMQEHGGRDQDGALAFMLVDINEHTKKRPLSEWKDDRIALYYQEWSEFSARLDEESRKEGLSREEVNKNARMASIVEGVKKSLLGQAKDKQGVILGSTLKAEEEKLVDGNKIKNKKIQGEFVKLLQDLQKGELKTPDQIKAAREKWRDLEVRFGGKLAKDPEAKKAIEKIRTYLSNANKELLARRNQKPSRLLSRGEPAQESAKSPEEPPKPPREEPRSEPRTEPRPERRAARASGAKGEQDEQYLDEETVREDEARRRRYYPHASASDDEARRAYLRPVDEAESAYNKYRAKSTAIKEAASGERKEKEDKARAEHKKAKSGWARNTEMKDKLSEDSTLWQKYGWSKQDREEVAKILGLDLDQARSVSQALLLKGFSGEAGRKEARELKGHVQSDNERMVESVAKKFINDEDVLKALRLPERIDVDAVAEQEYQGDPLSAEALAWQIAARFPETFGEKGESPVWERRYAEVDEHGRLVTDGMVKDEKGNLVKAGDNIRLEMHEAVNQENILLWFRNRVNYKQEQGPSERYNFYEEVKLDKKFGSPISLSKMLDNMEKMFAGSLAERVPDEFLPEDLKGTTVKEDYTELAEMLQIEAYLVTMVRQLHLAYDENKGDDGELVKQIQQLFDKNHLTKEVWGNKPLWQFMTLLPKEFDSLTTMDGGVGASVVKNYLAYYHISDFDELKRTLGEDATLFTVEGLRAARDKVSRGGEKYGDKAEDADRDYDDFSVRWDDKEGRYALNNQDLDKAFTILEVDRDEHGNLSVTKSEVRDDKKGRKAFTKLVNIFGSYTPDPRLVKMVKKAILEDASKGEDLSDTNKEYAHLIADHLTRFTGAAALNDIGFVGYDAFTRLMHTQGYREKMLKGEKKELDLDYPEDSQEKKETWMANRGGKVGNIHSIAQFRQLVVNPMLGIVTRSESDEKGPDGKALYNKPILYVLEELNSKRDEMKAAIKAATSEEKDKVAETHGEEYRDVAKQMRFITNAEQGYLNNSFNRGVELNKIVREGKGIEFDSYWDYSTEIGTHFNIQKFQADFIKMVTDVRYAFSTYGNLGYAMPIRGYDYESKEHKWMTLGQQMFGKQMLDIPEFKNEKGEIDYWRVDQKSHLLFKQFLLTYIGAEFIAARQFNKWSIAPRHEMGWYNSVVEVLEKIPGDILTGEKMKNVVVTNQFFEKDQINWLRELSSTQKANLYGWSAMKSIFLGGKKGKKEESVWEGLSQAFSIFFGGVFK